MAKQQEHSTKTSKTSNGANLGFEQKLWSAADKLRGHMDASEYKHVVLGLIFLKYISDAFEERHAELQKEKHADPEDRDEYAGPDQSSEPCASQMLIGLGPRHSYDAQL